MMRNIVKAGLILLSTAFSTQANAEGNAREYNPFMPFYGIDVLDHYGIKFGDMIWDDFRERDFADSSYCFDRNNDNFADRVNGDVETGDTKKYTLAVIDSTVKREQRTYKGITKAEAAAKMKNYQLAVGILLDSNVLHAQRSHVDTVYSVKRGIIDAVSRGNNAVGDDKTQKLCSRLGL